MAADLKGWLGEIGLGRYADAFAAHEIGWDVLGDLSEDDLKELGLSLGDRKRFLKALEGSPAAAAAPLSPLPAQAASGPSEGERRQLTVMFIDLIDSTPLAERFDPEVMRQVLGDFHNACVSAIEPHEGHIAQYSGDGLLVYFGYPRAHEDDAVRAVLAGLGIIANMRATNAQLLADHQVELHIRMGVETGLVVAGEVGAGSARDRQAIVGETPILAARLQTLAPRDAIVVGPATERLIRGAFELEDLGPQALKGVTEPVPVYRVVGPAEAADAFEIRAGRGLTPLVGRSAELEMLRQRWRQARDGEMRSVLLTGEAGIGKSRTLRAFRDSIADEDAEVVTFYGSPYHQDSPFWPVLQRLQAAFALDSKAFTAADTDRLRAALETFDVDREEAAMVLASLFGMPEDDDAPKIDTSSLAFKQRSLSVLVGMVESLTRQRPMLLAIEDAHWVDPSTLELVRMIHERLGSARLLVLMLARPEFQPGWSSPQLVQLNLDRLSRRDRFEMIESLTADKPLPDVIMNQIIAKTDGVPLFVEELTKAVLQGDMLRDAGSHYELKGVALAISIPDTLQGSLLSRLDRLDPGVKEVAQTAAIIGRDFDRGLLAMIVGKPEAELQTALDRLVEAEIILPSPRAGSEGAGYMFRHALIQDIAYQSLLLARRRHDHGLIAAALESHYPEIVEREPERLAQNLAASETPERAIDYWRQAGQRALERAAFEEAITHAQAGIALIESLKLTGRDRAVRLVPLLLIRGRSEYRLATPRAVGTYQEAARLAREQDLPALLVDAALGCEEANFYLGGAGTQGVVVLEEALAAVGDGDSVERCRLLSRLASSLHTAGSLDRAGDVTDEAIALARRIGDANGLLDALLCDLLDIGARPLPVSEFPERASRLEEIRQVAEGGDETYVGVASARCLACHLEMGDLASFDSTLARYEQVVAVEQDRVHMWVSTAAKAMRGILVGDFVLAEQFAENALKQAESVDAEFPTGVYGMQMFTIRREQGRLAEVAPLIKRFVDENPEERAWRPGLMLIASDVGFDAQAARMLDTMAEEDFPVPKDGKRLVTWTYLAEVAARLKQSEHAQRIYDALLPFQAQAVTVPSCTLCCGAAARYLGMLAGALGDWRAAEEHFEYALQMDERLQARPWLAHSRREYALMLSARNRKGDQKRAAGLLAEAAATAKDLNMFALIERIGAAAPSVGVV
ncbi:MAG TPA: AAA family ATPase [Caulobacteraceae bacterium]|nr:AAA family ATPase [Caulobacteraceae bacterium]